MNINESLKTFLVRCNAMNLQVKTIMNYKQRLGDFEKFLLEHNIDDVLLVTADTVREYLGSMNGRVKKITVLSYYLALSSFFNYLTEQEIIPKKPMDKVKKPRVGKRIIRAFTPKEIHLLLSAFDKNTFLGFRNYTIMSVFFSTGIRKAELMQLTCLDILFEIDMINVIGKGDKQRHIPLSPVLRKILLKYIKKRKEYIDESSHANCRYLFINKSCRPMTESTVNIIFANLKKEFQMQGARISAHTWRHTFAKTFLLYGGDMITLQMILGHSDVSTTKQYINLNDSDIKVQNEKFNPLDNTRWQYY